MVQTGSQNHVGAFSRRYQLGQIPAEGLSGRLETSADEQAAIARLLALESLDALSFTFELKPVGVRRFSVVGRLLARLKQICVVSLEPFDIDVDRSIEVEFVPEKEFLRRQEDAEGALADPAVIDLEPIEGGAIDLGQFAYECLATELEPYPRKPGIDFDWQPGAGLGADEDEGSFAALKALQKK